MFTTDADIICYNATKGGKGSRSMPAIERFSSHRYYIK